MANNYSMQGYSKENMARVIGRSLSISFKFSVEICNFIRNKSVNDAKEALIRVIEGKITAVPFRRFITDLGHKKKIGPGRYPKKASMEILDLLNSVEANAQFKGLNTSRLFITHISANKGTKVMHAGRKRGRKSKRTNIEIVVQERGLDKKTKEAANKGAKPQEKEIKQSKKTESEKTKK